MATCKQRELQVSCRSGKRIPFRIEDEIPSYLSDLSEQAGDVLFGSVTFNADDQSYTMYHSDMNDGWSVSTTIPGIRES